MNERIVFPDNITVYLDDKGKVAAAFQDFPIFDEDDPSEIIGYETATLDSKDLMKIMKGCDIMSKRKANLDDGCNPELLRGAELTDGLEFPIIKPPANLIVPSGLTPFTKREKALGKDEGICFFEKDPEFAEVLKSPEAYVDDLKRFPYVLPMDCSVYRDAPLEAQTINIYRSRVIGSYYQRMGCNIYPLARWGNEYTYTTKYFPDRIAFLGLPKHSIICVGTYGNIQSHEDKYYFKGGLEAMLETLEPEIVLVYGAMPSDVFGDYLKSTKFVQYPDWTKRVRGGDC